MDESLENLLFSFLYFLEGKKKFFWSYFYELKKVFEEIMI